MSYLFNNVDEITGTLTTAKDEVPMTIACRVKVADWDAANARFMSFTDGGATEDNSLFLHNRFSTGDQVSATARNTGNGNATYQGSAGEFDGVWVTIVGTYTSSVFRDVYVNSFVNSANDTTSRGLTNNLDTVILGNRAEGSNDANGLLAYCAIWDVVLSEGDITAYLNATSKADIAAINSSNLIGFWPLDTDNSTQLNEGVDATGDLTVTGAQFSTDDPFTIDPIIPLVPMVIRRPSTEIARDFDGATNGVTWPVNFNWAATPQTISLWLDCDITDPAGQTWGMRVLNDGDGSAQKGVILRFANQSVDSLSNVLFEVRGTTTLRVKTDNASTGQFPTQKWAQLLATWDGGLAQTGMHVYFNGVEATYYAPHGQDGSGFYTDMNETSLGAFSWDSTGACNGRLAGVGRWTRVLGAAEIQLLAGGLNPADVPNGLKWHPDFSNFRGKVGGAPAVVGVIDHYEKPPLLRPATFNARKIYLGFDEPADRKLVVF